LQTAAHSGASPTATAICTDLKDAQQSQQLLAGYRVQALLRQVPMAPASTALSAADAAASYAQALQLAASIQADRVDPATQRAEAQMGQELHVWLQQHHAGLGRRLADCTPADVIAFLGHWATQKHGSTLGSDGHIYAAPNYLATACSHLSSFFKAAGRTGEWSLYYPVSAQHVVTQVLKTQIHTNHLGRDDSMSCTVQANNPCRHESVSEFLAGYSKKLWRLGYAVTSAKHLEFSKYDTLMQQLYEELESMLQNWDPKQPKDYMPVLRQLRNMCLFAHQWESSMRGDNSRRFSPDELQDLHGQPLAGSLLQPSFPFSAGFKYQLAPNGTKPRQQRRAGSLPMQVMSEEQMYRDPLRLLHLYIQVRHSRNLCISANRSACSDLSGLFG
jgi:hypothetical protein